MPWRLGFVVFALLAGGAAAEIPWPSCTPNVVLYNWYVQPATVSRGTTLCYAAHALGAESPQTQFVDTEASRSEVCYYELRSVGIRPMNMTFDGLGYDDATFPTSFGLHGISSYAYCVDHLHPEGCGHLTVDVTTRRDGLFVARAVFPTLVPCA